MRCAVCGKEKPDYEFGDGMKVPKTTCMDCYKKAIEQCKVEAARWALADQIKEPDPSK